MEAGYLPPQAENNQRSRGGWVPQPGKLRETGSMDPPLRRDKKP